MRSILILGFSLMLSGCSFPGNIVSNVRYFLHSASGNIHTITDHTAATIELGKMATDKALKLAEDAKRRAGDIEEGMKKIQEGKEQVKSAVSP
ncbi:hypothetical protein EXS70_05195 [Candidatus Peribacteria bacterium]|nr:hypothetical protein [Candidatus Peribacteria bacterium]